MFKEYELRWLRKEDLDDYIIGLNKFLYDRYNKERFQWKFDQNPYSIGFNPIVVVEECRTGKLVGFNAFIPLEIRLGGKLFLTLQGCDSFVNRAHRRRGLFIKTIRFIVEKLVGRGPEFLFGFNFEGSTAAAKKAGSTPICDINMWNLNADVFEKRRSMNKMEISLELCGVDHAHNIYSVWAQNRDVLHVHRSLEYLKWRFSLSPLKEYTIYSVNLDDSELGYVVVGIVENDEGEIILGLDDLILFDTRPIVVTQVLSCIVDRIDDVDTIELFTPVRRDLNRIMGFLGGKSQSRYTMILKGISFDKTSNNGLFYRGVELSRSDGWYITTSDIF